MLQITINFNEYQRLLTNSTKLECLISAGVDNWEGYDEAMQMFAELKKELENEMS